MAKFVQIQTCYGGNVEDELNSITQESVDKLLKVLDIVGEVEG